jgi:hypothetical protein
MTGIAASGMGCVFILAGGRGGEAKSAQEEIRPYKTVQGDHIQHRATQTGRTRGGGARPKGPACSETIDARH